MKPNPKVSVCMITYSHEKYIREAIEGVLMQECDFVVELIIANDCSPDQTDTVIQNILENHPRASLIKYIKHEKNIGMMPNFIFALQQCKGEYIALCEGDDYWTDPLKLQKQIDFLEMNPDYVLSCHDTKVINAGGELIKNSKLPIEWQRDFTEYELLRGACIMPLTMCFRNVIGFPEEFYNVKNGDTFLISLLGAYGKAKFEREIMSSAYREHLGGVWSMIPDFNRLLAQKITYFNMFRYYNKIKILNNPNRYYLGHYQQSCHFLVKSYFSSRELLKGFQVYCEFVLECIKIKDYKRGYFFTKKMIIGK